MRLEPIATPPCVGNEGYGELCCLLHLLYYQCLQLFALFGQYAEIQFVVHLQYHTAFQSFHAHTTVHTYHGNLHDVGGASLYGRVDGIALGIASHHGIVAIDVGQGATAMEDGFRISIFVPAIKG